MSMMHFEPFRSLRDLDRLTSQLLSGTQMPHVMPMDVWREGQSYRVALDLPGVDPESIDIRVERNTLTIAAERRPDYHGGGASAGAGEQGEDQVQLLVAERPQGSFSRQLVLGEGLDTSAVEADYRDGVLHLTIPVHQAAQPRRIQVGRSSAGQTTQPRVIEGDPESGETGQAGGTSQQGGSGQG